MLAAPSPTGRAMARPAEFAAVQGAAGASGEAEGNIEEQASAASGRRANGEGRRRLAAKPAAASSDDSEWRCFTPAKISSTLCMARTWAKGSGGQCTKRPDAGAEYCSQHVKEDKWRVHGRVDGPIPQQKLLEFEKAAGGPSRPSEPSKASERKRKAQPAKNVAHAKRTPKAEHEFGEEINKFDAEPEAEAEPQSTYVQAGPEKIQSRAPSEVQASDSVEAQADDAADPGRKVGVPAPTSQVTSAPRTMAAAPLSVAGPAATPAAAPPASRKHAQVEPGTQKPNAATAPDAKCNRRTRPARQRLSAARRARPQKKASTKKAARDAKPSARTNRASAKEQPKPLKCTCGNPIHSEKCKLFRTTYVPGFSTYNAREHPADRSHERVRAGLCSGALPRVAPTTTPTGLSAWASTEVRRIAAEIAALPRGQRRNAYRQKMRLFHPDKQHGKERTSPSEAEVTEVFRELKRRYDDMIA